MHIDPPQVENPEYSAAIEKWENAQEDFRRLKNNLQGILKEKEDIETLIEEAEHLRPVRQIERS